MSSCVEAQGSHLVTGVIGQGYSKRGGGGYEVTKEEREKESEKRE